MPTTVSSTPNCARMQAFDRLDEPLPMRAFSSATTSKPRSASRTAVSAPVTPPPMITTRSDMNLSLTVSRHVTALANRPSNERWGRALSDQASVSLGYNLALATTPQMDARTSARRSVFVTAAAQAHIWRRGYHTEMRPDTSGDPQPATSSDNRTEAATPRSKQPPTTPPNADGAQPQPVTVSADAPAAPPPQRTTQRAPRKAATTKATVQDAPPPPAAPLVQETQAHTSSISPTNAVFVSVCFEGPDIYSTAGGLGTRVTELCESLAMQGYETHLIFVGDPNKPARETLVDGKLHLERWGQWISKYYPNGVYDGEEQKLYDYSQSVPLYICEQIVRPAVEEGKIVVIIGEDWHTAETICRTSDLLLRAQSASPRRLDVELQ